MPDAAGERLRRAQHPGHRRQARAADPQRDEHRRRRGGQRQGDRPAAGHVQQRRRLSATSPIAGSCPRRCCRRCGTSACPRSATCWPRSRRRSCSDLGADDAIITVATDGAAMYPSERDKISAARLRRRFHEPRRGRGVGRAPRQRADSPTRSSARNTFATGSSTSATTRGSSSRARRSNCSRPAARSRSGRGLRRYLGVWDEMIARVQRPGRRRVIGRRPGVALCGVRRHCRHRDAAGVRVPELVTLRSAPCPPSVGNPRAA